MKPLTGMLLATLALAATACQQPPAADPDESFAAWAAEHALPLRTVEPSDDVSDLRALDSIIGDARVVALGEPAHGAHEPLALRNRLFAYLVEHHGFSAIALETAYPEARAMADYVAGGPATVEQAAAGFSWGFAAFQANRELLDWMRAYNADPSHTRKLTIHGIDLSLGGMGGSVPTTAAFDEVFAYLATVDAAAADSARDAFERWRPMLPGGPIPEPVVRDSLVAYAAQLAALLGRNRDAYTAETDAETWTRAWRNAVNARQGVDVLRAMPIDVGGSGIPPSAWRSLEARDQAMAENTLWSLESLGRDGRIFVFAHNLHVKSTPTMGGVWDGLAQAPASMGQNLRDALGDDYVVIGMSGARSTQGPISAAQDPASVDAALGRVGHPLFALDLRSARQSSGVAEWLTQPRPIATNFDTHLIVPVGDAFDAIIYAETLNPAASAD